MDRRPDRYDVRREGEYFFPAIPGLCGCAMAILFAAIVGLGAYLIISAGAP